MKEKAPYDIYKYSFPPRFPWLVEKLEWIEFFLKHTSYTDESTLNAQCYVHFMFELYSMLELLAWLDEQICLLVSLAVTLLVTLVDFGVVLWDDGHSLCLFSVCLLDVTFVNTPLSNA
jgi:hypothetical protein